MHKSALNNVEHTACRHQLKFVARVNLTFLEPYVDDNTLVAVVIAVKNERLQRFVVVALGGGQFHDGFQHRFDADAGLRNLDISLGLSDVPVLNFLDITHGHYLLEQLQSHPLFPTLWFLTAPVNIQADEINEESFAQLIRKAKELFDYVLLDSPAGMDAGFRLTALNADRLFVVTNSDPAAIRDAGRIGQVLELMGKTNVRLIVNRIDRKMANLLNITVDDIMDQAGLPLLGIVPEDPDVMLAATFQKPLLCYTKKGAAAACKRIAKRMQGNYVPVKLK